MDNVYKLPIGDTMSEAWGKVHGAKGTVWAAIAIQILIFIVFSIAANIFHKNAPAVSSLINFILQIVNFLISAGMLYIGIQRAADLPIDYRMMFRAFNWEIGIRVIGAYILMMLILIPAILLSILGFFTNSTFLTALCFVLSALLLIYLSLRMFLSFGLVVDKRLNPWEAIKASFKGTRSNVFSLLIIFILQMIILAVSALALLIGLIWTLPFAYILYGTVYKRLQVNI